MIPITLDPARLALALVGRGPKAVARLGQLIEGGAADIRVYSDAPTSELAALAGARLVPRLPERADLAGVRVVWIVDLPDAAAAPLAGLARASGALVNVEDVVDLCDFHAPSIVRRGALLLTVSTGGRSPRLTVRIRRRLEQLFGVEWGARTDRLGRDRLAWRAEGRSAGEIAELTDRVIDREGWLA